MSYCDECGHAYFWSMSDAEENNHFCSKECEEKAARCGK